jgi:hypothetical protein
VDEKKLYQLSGRSSLYTGTFPTYLRALDSCESVEENKRYFITSACV